MDSARILDQRTESSRGRKRISRRWLPTWITI